MTCTEFQDLVVIAIHGRLTVAQREEIVRHRSACAGCAALYERSASLIDLQTEALEQAASAPTPDWDGPWAAIAEQALLPKRPVPSFFGRIPRWAPVAAAVALVFVLGFFAGKIFRVDDTAVRPATAAFPAAGSGSSLDLTDYADSLKPVLISFLNRGNIVPPAELRALESGIIRDMLSRTRALKSLAAESGDSELGDFLIDLEFILTSLANLEPGDKASAAFLTRMIREKDVPLRLRELASPATI